MNGLFKDKVILLDGAASGIGKQTAIQLSRQGAKIILLDLDESLLSQTMLELDSKGHCSYAYDLSGLLGIDDLVKKIVADCGPIDGYVHCVGIRCRRPLNLLKPEVLQNVMSVNFGSFIEMCRCLTKKGRYNAGMSIVAISSISAKSGGATVSAYAASKAAIDASVRCLAKELAPKGIRINTVQPGQINTPAYAALLDNNGGIDPVLERQYLGLGEAEDVANAISFLLSDQAKMITGAAIPLDGGYFTS